MRPAGRRRYGDVQENETHSLCADSTSLLAHTNGFKRVAPPTFNRG